MNPFMNSNLVHKVNETVHELQVNAIHEFQVSVYNDVWGCT